MARRFAGSGLAHGAMRFEAPVFVPGETTLRLDAQETAIRLLPLHPTVFRPGNFPDPSFSAPLVYLGTGDVADVAGIAGTDLTGTLAVMEFACGERWQHFLRFGVQGFVFLDAERYHYRDAVGKVYSTEVAVPRFFAAARDAALLRTSVRAAHKPVQAQVQSSPSRWENRTLRDVWVLVPGADEELSRDVVVITAPMDSNCVVPQLATGAQAGANLFLLLQLFDEFRQHPPARSVLFGALNAHTYNFMGERVFAWHLLTPRATWEQAQDTLAEDLRVETMFLEQYGKLKLTPETRAADQQFLIKLRTLVDSSTGKHRTIKEPLVDLIRREVNLLKSEQLRLVRQGLGREQLQQGIDELADRRTKYVNVLTLFNKVGIKTTLADLTPEELGILRGFVAQICERRQRWAELNRRDLEVNAENSSIRNALAGRSVKFVLSLDLVWTEKLVGFSSNNFWGVERWPHKWGTNTSRIASALPALQAGGKQGLPTGVAVPEPQPLENLFVDTMTKRGGLPEGHFYPGGSPGVAIFHSANRTPAFAVMNVYCDQGRAFLPSDTFDHLDMANTAGNMAFIPVLLRAMLEDRNLTAPSELQEPSSRAAWATQLKTFKFDDFAASVLPQLPVPGSVVTLLPWTASNQPPLVAGAVIRSSVALTDCRAARMVYGMTDPVLLTNAFHLDPDFVRIDHAIDAGEIEAKMGSSVYPGTRSKLLPLFECNEFPIYTRHSTSAISVSPILVTTYIALSGKLNSAPKKYGMSGVSSVFSDKGIVHVAGPAAFFTEPGEHLKLLTSNKNLALNATAEYPEGTGFASFADMGPDFFAVAVRDMARLNHARETRLRGVSDDLARDFLKRGDAAMARTESAREERHFLQYLRALYEAQGAHAKAYLRTADVTNDMLKAIVFYLALMLPFCFFMEKMLFRFKRIESEMLAFGLLFVVTFLVFRQIHPAFRVAQAPEAIFVAFIMGGLGAFVIKILHGRFEGEMQLLFRTYPGMEAGTARYSTVGQEAMLIGVNNMKRRRVRTTLTTATIVLVTFTMLAFTSISRKMSPTVVTKSNNPPYTGLMYHWPGNSRMDEATLRVFKELFFGRADYVVRRWILPPTSHGDVVPFRVAASNGGTAQLDAVLGLSMAEDGFLADIPLAAGRYFSSADAAEALLPASMARALGITPENFEGQTLRFQGHELRVVGLLIDKSFGMMKDLNKRPLLPIKTMLEQAQGQQDEVVTDPDSEDEAEEGVFYVDMSALIVVPETTAEQLGGQPYSISVRFRPDEPIWPCVDELLTVTSANKFYISSAVPFTVGAGSGRTMNAGIYYIGEGYRTSVGGLTSLLIPLLIAATIILNTMLGSVFERKSEIAIYNAVGLNPTHIGMFFLAESFVYSVIGSVGGYLIGQMMTIFLTRTGLITEINLNFSSLSVVYVILFTVGVVLLSTIYPSIVATKAAVPSGKRKWSLPATDGNTMDVVFPFIYQPELITGIMGYLADYFARFTEASFGDLIATLDGRSSGRDPQARPTYCQQYSVALAPFDLGVTQRLVFAAAFDDRVHAYRITMNVQRLSGQDTNWTTTNRPFLERLRTYLLHWRNLDPAEHTVFVQQGDALFAGTEADTSAG